MTHYARITDFSLTEREEQIFQLIQSKWLEAEPLPSINALCTATSLSRDTVRSYIERLKEKRRLIYARRSPHYTVQTDYCPHCKRPYKEESHE